MKKIVLTVEDEINILELLKYNLENNGFDVLQASSGELALKLLEEKPVDIILLDVLLPGIDGFQVLKTIKSNPRLNKIPVIMLTAKTEEIDKVVGLEIGADDYISKPFGIHELIARIKAVLRRVDDSSNIINTEDIIKIDNIIINKTTYEVYDGDRLIELSLKEFELLYLLAKNRGMVFDREYIVERIWGYEYYGETRTVDVHIRNLRKKIEKDDKNPIYIKTIRGIGYKFS